MNLSDPVDTLPKIGSKYAELLENLGIKTVHDLLMHIPSRYEDHNSVKSVEALLKGTDINEEKATILVEISKIDNVFTRNGKRFVKALGSDSTGKVEIIWFNQPYLKNSIPVGSKVSLFGKIEREKSKIKMISPQYEVVRDEDSELIHTEGIVPTYPLTAGLSTKWIRGKIKYALDNLDITETLPEKLRIDNELIDRQIAINKIHFPENENDIKESKSRLSFEEFLLIHLKGLYLRHIWDQTKNSHIIDISLNEVNAFKNTLPFTLTDSQEIVINEIFNDLKSKNPMNRLLQGDVGSGKTIVALLACLAAIKNGFNVIYLAPTQILAKQHFATFKKLLNNIEVDIILQVSDKENKRQVESEGRASSSIHQNKYIVIGTHAILHRLENFNNIGLVVIDEQHKFGVAQRTDIIKYYTHANSANGTELAPNLLTMTATPIPRSVALTLYGDLDLSIIENPPKNRKPTVTWLINEAKRASCYEWMKKEMKTENLQSIVVCPFIEESDSAELSHVKSAEKTFDFIKEKFPEFRVGLLHGRMKSDEKNSVIDDFSAHKLDILVTTPVIEVGVDIPNANIIFIETSERFGLASLHQLRGRVGRGEKQGYCILMPSSKDGNSLKRLKYLETVHNGQKLAEIDFQLRGPGNIYGFEQHGAIDLKVGNFHDIDLIKKTKEAALSIINNEIEPTEYLKKYLESIYKIAKN